MNGTLTKSLLAAFLCLAALAFPPGARAEERGIRIDGNVKQWAIIIGISDYAFDRQARGEQGLPDLAGAANDARAYYDFLTDKQKVPKERILLLTDKKATVRGIRRAFLTLGRQAGENDQFLVFFAGHGIAGPEAGNRSYLLAHDSELTDLEATAILFDEFAMWVQNEIPANKKLLVVDACHSGNFLGSIRGASRNRINDQMMDRLRASQGTAFITASSGSQVSVEKDGRGLFTSAWLKALAGDGDRDRDGLVTVSEAYQYAYAAILGDSRTRQSPTQGGSYDFGMPLALAGPAGEAAAPSPAPARPAPPAAQKPAQARTMYVGDAGKITMRTGPDLYSKIIAIVEGGESLELLEENSGWALVRLPASGKEGWIMARYLSPEKPAAAPPPPSAVPAPAPAAVPDEPMAVLADGSWDLPDVSPPSGPPERPTVSVSARATAPAMGAACKKAASLAAQKHFQGNAPGRREFQKSVYRLYCNTVLRTYDNQVRVEVVIEFFKEAEHET